MSTNTLILSRFGLTADRVRQLCPGATPARTTPKPKRNWHGVRSGTHINAVAAWMENAKSGDRCDLNTFSMSPATAGNVFGSLVSAGKVRVAVACKRGPGGHPTIYEKV
jgi:hypothetical protein